MASDSLCLRLPSTSYAGVTSTICRDALFYAKASTYSTICGHWAAHMLLPNTRMNPDPHLLRSALALRAGYAER
jgi:hypothetical protein